MFEPESKTCAKCGGQKILPVVWGLPTKETFQRAVLGEVLLGGCMVFSEAPDWRCADCGANWEEPPDRE